MPALFNIFEKRQCHGRSVLLFVGALLCGGSGAHAGNRANVHTITIEGMQFSPKTIEVNVGDTVIWKNTDIVTHTATADDKAFNSGDIPTNRSWKFVARKKGSFPYSCTLHPTMKGSLVVK